MQDSKIEWTDSTWNPVRGCSRVSEGCRNCYAEKIAARFSSRGSAFQFFADQYQPGSKWTGKVALIEDKLSEPLSWRKPRKIFVNSMSDLFHENLPNEAIDRVFAVMALCPQHTFQILTKRAPRMLKYLSQGPFNGYTHGRTPSIKKYLAELVGHETPRYYAAIGRLFSEGSNLLNAWFGVSVENQETADERIPLLLKTPAAVRFISAEPLLGQIDARPYLEFERCGGGHRTRDTRLDWVITGGESGPGARPMHPDWARSLRDQCAAAGVPFFFKQWGEWTAEMRPGTEVELEQLQPNQCVAWGDGKTNHTLYTRVGKKAAGRLLDGKEHSEFPEVKQ